MEAGRATNVESPFLSGNVTEITKRDEAATAPPTTLTLASRMRRGRSFGAAPSEVRRANTLTPSTGVSAGHTMSCRPIGGYQGPGAGGSSSVLALCP
jgi:hypothetical protein